MFGRGKQTEKTSKERKRRSLSEMENRNSAWKEEIGQHQKNGAVKENEGVGEDVPKSPHVPRSPSEKEKGGDGYQKSAAGKIAKDPSSHPSAAQDKG